MDGQASRPAFIHPPLPISLYASYTYVIYTQASLHILLYPCIYIRAWHQPCVDIAYRSPDEVDITADASQMHVV